MKVRESICGECPFRREGWAGWLGSNKPEDFAEVAMSETSLACHMQVNQELPRPDWEAAETAAPRCRGALIMLKNKCMLPRNPALAALVKTLTVDHQTVFSNQNQFIDHHNAATVKSWKFNETKTKKKK